MTVIVNKVFLLQVTVTGVSRAGLTWWGDLELLGPPVHLRLLRSGSGSGSGAHVFLLDYFLTS